MPVIFVTGTDTGTGKSIVTGAVARYLLGKGKSVITQKLIETGCETGFSEDIRTHRGIMETGMFKEDISRLTSPYTFIFPASPHLSASLEERVIEMNRLKESTGELSRSYEYVIIEGAGGVYVPLSEDYTLLDYIEENTYPVILVTSSRLGSINHTLLTLEALRLRKIPLQGLVYNRYPPQHKEIEEDSIEVFRLFLKKFGFSCPAAELFPVPPEGKPEIRLEEIIPVAPPLSKGNNA